MKHHNDIIRMQKLAGIITESDNKEFNITVGDNWNVNELYPEYNAIEVGLIYGEDNGVLGQRFKFNEDMFMKLANQMNFADAEEFIDGVIHDETPEQWVEWMQEVNGNHNLKIEDVTVGMIMDLLKIEYDNFIN
jgi:biotin-(acetyl-CoA carboxylase) ligase